MQNYKKFIKICITVLSNCSKYAIIVLLFYGDVAQLARAPGSYPVGREFESLRRYQLEYS